MFNRTINGLDKIINADLPDGSIVLVEGEPGTLKSAMVFTVLSNNVRSSGQHGLYATLEERRESHLRNMSSLGVDPPENLTIFDYRDIRREFNTDEEELDALDILEKTIEFYKEKYGDEFKFFALDSLNALYAIIDRDKLRNKLYHFFEMLREHNLKSLVIAEMAKSSDGAIEYGGESFLGDGIVLVGIQDVKDDVIRYIQFRKMRGTKHSMKKYQMEVNGGGLTILGPLYEINPN